MLLPVPLQRTLPWQVLDLTQFPSDDPAITRSQAVANVRAAMANGNTVALMYASSIHGSLYDLLNQVRAAGQELGTRLAYLQS